MVSVDDIQSIFTHGIKWIEPGQNKKSYLVNEIFLFVWIILNSGHMQIDKVA